MHLKLSVLTAVFPPVVEQFPNSQDQGTNMSHKEFLIGKTSL